MNPKKATTAILALAVIALAAIPASAHPASAPPGHATTVQGIGPSQNTCYMYGYTDIENGFAQPQVEFYKESSNGHTTTSAAENVPVYDAVEYAWETLEQGGDPPLAPDSTSGLQRGYDHQYTGATAAANWLTDCVNG